MSDAPTGPVPADGRDRTRTIAATALGALGALFAALNFDEVEVNWILGTWSTPLFVVIVVSFVLGVGAGFLLASRRAAAERAPLHR
jgi:uncharacterized integral membrane protein